MARDLLPSLVGTQHLVAEMAGSKSSLPSCQALACTLCAKNDREHKGWVEQQWSGESSGLAGEEPWPKGPVEAGGGLHLHTRLQPLPTETWPRVSLLGPWVCTCRPRNSVTDLMGEQKWHHVESIGIMWRTP